MEKSKIKTLLKECRGGAEYFAAVQAMYAGLARRMRCDNEYSILSRDIVPEYLKKWDKVLESEAEESIRKILEEETVLKEYLLHYPLSENCFVLPVFPEVVTTLTGKNNYQNGLNMFSAFGMDARKMNDLQAIKTLDCVERDEVIAAIQKVENLFLGSSIVTVNNDSFFYSPGKTYDFIFGEIPFGLRKIDIAQQSAPFRDGSGFVSAEFTAIENALPLLNENGKAAFLINNAALFKSTDEKQRQSLVDNDRIEKIVLLPPLLTGSSVKPAVIILGKSGGSIQMQDFSFWTSSERRNPFKRSDEFIKFFMEHAGDEKHSVTVSKEEIVKQNYRLNPDYYITARSLRKFDRTARIDEVASVLIGKNALNKERGSGCFLVDSGCFEDQKLNVHNMKEIKDKPSAFKDSYLQKDDILVFSKGSAPFIAIAPDMEGKKVIPSSNILVIRPDHNKIDPSYLMAYLSSDDGKRRLGSISTGSVISHIPASQLMQMTIPVTDLDSQKLLGAEYEALQDGIAQAKNEYAKLTEKRNRLFDIECKSFGIK